MRIGVFQPETTQLSADLLSARRVLPLGVVDPRAAGGHGDHEGCLLLDDRRERVRLHGRIIPDAVLRPEGGRYTPPTPALDNSI